MIAGCANDDSAHRRECVDGIVERRCGSTHSDAHVNHCWQLQVCLNVQKPSEDVGARSTAACIEDADRVYVVRGIWRYTKALAHDETSHVSTVSVSVRRRYGVAIKVERDSAWNIIMRKHSRIDHVDVHATLVADTIYIAQVGVVEWLGGLVDAIEGP